MPSSSTTIPHPAVARPLRNRALSAASSNQSLTSSPGLSVCFDADGIPHFDTSPHSPALRASTSRSGSLSSAPTSPVHGPAGKMLSADAESAAATAHKAPSSDMAGAGAGAGATTTPTSSKSAAPPGTIDRHTAERILRMTEEEQENVTLALIRRLDKLHAEKETIARTLRTHGESGWEHCLRSDHGLSSGAAPTQPPPVARSNATVPIGIPPPHQANLLRGLQASGEAGGLWGGSTPPLGHSPPPMTPRSMSMSRLAVDIGGDGKAAFSAPPPTSALAGPERRARASSTFAGHALPSHLAAGGSLRGTAEEARGPHPHLGPQPHAGWRSHRDADARASFLEQLAAFSASAEQLARANDELSTFARDVLSRAAVYEAEVRKLCLKHNDNPSVHLPPLPPLPAWLDDHRTHPVMPGSPVERRASLSNFGARPTTRQRQGTITSPSPPPPTPASSTAALGGGVTGAPYFRPLPSHGGAAHPHLWTGPGGLSLSLGRAASAASPKSPSMPLPSSIAERRDARPGATAAAMEASSGPKDMDVDSEAERGGGSAPLPALTESDSPPPTSCGGGAGEDPMPARGAEGSTVVKAETSHPETPAEAHAMAVAAEENEGWCALEGRAVAQREGQSTS